MDSKIFLKFQVQYLIIYYYHYSFLKLRYDLHTVQCPDLQYTVRWILTSMCMHVTYIPIEILNISMPRELPRVPSRLVPDHPRQSISLFFLILKLFKIWLMRASLSWLLQSFCHIPIDF